MDINTIDYSDVREKLLKRFGNKCAVSANTIYSVFFNIIIGDYEESQRFVEVLIGLNIIKSSDYSGFYKVVEI